MKGVLQHRRRLTSIEKKYGVGIAERSSEEAWTSADSILRRPVRRGGKRESFPVSVSLD